MPNLWLLYDDLGSEALVIDGVRIPIVLCFALGSLTFVPLGQLVAQRLNVFRSYSTPLWGYALDLSGSLLGVVAFGWNLIGAVVGGLIEFFSMSIGLRALLLVALFVYLAAFFLKGRQDQVGTQPLASPP